MDYDFSTIISFLILTKPRTSTIVVTIAITKIATAPESVSSIGMGFDTGYVLSNGYTGCGWLLGDAVNEKKNILKI